MNYLLPLPMGPPATFESGPGGLLFSSGLNGNPSLSGSEEESNGFGFYGSISFREFRVYRISASSM